MELTQPQYDIFSLGFDKFLSKTGSAFNISSDYILNSPTDYSSSALGSDLGGSGANASAISDPLNPQNLVSGEIVGNVSIKDGYFQSSNFVTGISGWRLSPTSAEINVSTAIKLLDIPNTISVNSFHVDTTGNAWWGATTIGGAVAKVLNTGAATFSNITITGGSVATSVLSGTIAQTNLNLADRGWTQTSTFTVTDADTIAWGAGTLTSADGTAYSIGAGNTGNMSAKTYIYLDIAVSLTVYQTTTTSTTAVGVGKVMVAIAQNGTTEATYQVLQGQGGQNIDAANIVAGSITANEIAASTITTGKLVATAIDGMTITGALIRTAVTNTFRSELRASGTTLGDELVFVSSGNVDLAHIGGLSDGTLKLSSGVSEATFLYLTVTGSEIGVKGHLIPYTDDDYNLGSASYRWGTIYPRFISISQTDTNEDLPPVYITSAQDSNVINLYNTNSGISNRPAFRFESNNTNANSSTIYVVATGSGAAALVAQSTSNTYPTIYINQSGTSDALYANGGTVDDSGVWHDASSVLLKENFESVSVLDKLLNLDIKKFNYISSARKSKNDIENILIDKKKRENYIKKNGQFKGTIEEDYSNEKLSKAEIGEISFELDSEYEKETQREIQKHISPMAEDFYSIFGVGDNKSIAPKDLAGVALQAIKELNQKVELLENKIKNL